MLKMESKCTDNDQLVKGEVEGGGAGEEEEEALSLCDLPTSEENLLKEEDVLTPTPRNNEIQEDFDFCSFSKESEMCAADEVFFQGQILPLRTSVSSEKGFINGFQSDSRCITRCASMDRCYSVGFPSVSSRSSSIRSHQSSSSGSTCSSSINRSKNTIPRVRNQFHSHPSPTPQVRPSSIKQANVPNSAKKSSLWSIFHAGLITPPEIALQDLKFRRENPKNFGSRNSTSSTNSDLSNVSSNKKNKPRSLFSKKGVSFASCKCSANAVDTISPRVVFINRSANDQNVKSTEENHQQQERVHRTGKQALSRNRTFEWLKQLSLESATDEEALLPM